MSKTQWHITFNFFTNLRQIMDDYWELLPRYQGVEVDDLKFLRILYGKGAHM